MSVTEDLINFDIIEDQKENIQSLPSGRSAKALFSAFSPPLANKHAPLSPLSNTQDLNNIQRQEYERELEAINESDDPLDVYDRYVRWTMNAYPTSQATPQSQLLPLLERATRTFLDNPVYKNDPRYLRLWLHYIRLFSDAPRETFSYLARHNIGSSLGLFYEEFAAWLEGAGRWNQAAEIYKMGIENQARPAERLIRRFGEFERRAAEKAHENNGPSSPAMPLSRPALAAKVDPFMTRATAETQPAQRASTTSNSKKQKLQIFSDEAGEPTTTTKESVKGWTSLQGIAERKKENVMGAKPMAGEKLGVGSKLNDGIPKMMVFKDERQINHNQIIHDPNVADLSCEQITVDARTGRPVYIAIELEAIYPNPQDLAEEYLLEDLEAESRGWLSHDMSQECESQLSLEESSTVPASSNGVVIPLKVPLNDATETSSPREEPQAANKYSQGSTEPVAGKPVIGARVRKEEKADKTRKIVVREMKNETQTIQTNLNSPRKTKLRRKKDPTMTLHTKAAHEEIYDIFNDTVEVREKNAPLENESSGESDADSEDDDDYTTDGGESTCTGRASATTSDFGDETQDEVTEADAQAAEDADGEATATENSVWSEFTTSKHIPRSTTEEDEIDDVDAEACDSPTTSEMNTVAEAEKTDNHVVADQALSVEATQSDELVTPTSPSANKENPITRYIQLPIKDFEAPTMPYRDAVQVANNRLPFMTPIVEQTESSVGAATAARQEREYFATKTPSRQNGELRILGSSRTDFSLDDDEKEEEELLNSSVDPILEESTKLNEEMEPALQVAPLIDLTSSSKPTQKEGNAVSYDDKNLKHKPAEGRQSKRSQSPIIKDSQCNPMDTAIQNQILEFSQTPLSELKGFFDHRNTTSGRRNEIKKFCKSNLSTGKTASKADKTNVVSDAPKIKFDDVGREYTIRRELGAGAFAPVYLVEQSCCDSANDSADADYVADRLHGMQLSNMRRPLEAIKLEHDPPNPWEFYILQTAQRRMGVSRANESIVQAYEMHLFADEAFLVEEYREQGTLLDLVNSWSRENAAAGHTEPGMDEMLAMFFVVELLRTMESMHKHGLIHGDLKADNVLVRFGCNSKSYDSQEELSSTYRPSGADAWSNYGITLIDFGRGIDMRAFAPDVQFIADWPTSATDCAEMRELRPWTYQADYHGIAAIAYTMLFGRYIETVAEKGGSLSGVGGKSYRLRENLKRYWQTEIWAEFFALTLNPARGCEEEEGGRMPRLKAMRRCRESMEAWLQANCERGYGLKGLVRKGERLVAERIKARKGR